MRIEAESRKRLERLCRYVTRPPQKSRLDETIYLLLLLLELIEKPSPSFHRPLRTTTLDRRAYRSRIHSALSALRWATDLVPAV